MSKYVALLRGINVGGNRKVSMADLRELFHTLGFTDISTYINSGNILFSTPNPDTVALALTIEHALLQHHGFPIPCLVRSQKNINALVKSIPTQWENTPEQRTEILFLWKEYDQASSIDLIKINPTVDRLIYLPGAIVWNISRAHIRQGGMPKFIGSELYKHMTGRNVNTVRKLSELMHEAKNTQKHED